MTSETNQLRVQMHSPVAHVVVSPQCDLTIPQYCSMCTFSAAPQSLHCVYPVGSGNVPVVGNGELDWVSGKLKIESDRGVHATPT